MNTTHFYIRLAAVLALATVTVPASAAPTASAQQNAYDQSDAPASHDLIGGAHVEGHVAFLHAELAITPAQEALWGPVADAMREDVKTMETAEDKIARQSPDRETAIRYLQNRTLFAEMRAQGESRFLAAMEPLYNSLSSQQKQMADELLIDRMPE